LNNHQKNTKAKSCVSVSRFTDPNQMGYLFAMPSNTATAATPGKEGITRPAETDN